MQNINEKYNVKIINENGIKYNKKNDKQIDNEVNE